MVINVLKIRLCILHEKNNVVLLVLDNNNLIKNNLIISISVLFLENKKATVTALKSYHFFRQIQ